MDPNDENDVEMMDASDIILPFDDEVELGLAVQMNIACDSHVLNEQQTAFWNKACIHPLNCDESMESMQEMVERFQKNPGNLSRKFQGKTPLSEALRAGHAKCVDFIIKNHTDHSELMQLTSMLCNGMNAPEGKFRDTLEVLIKNNLLDWSRVYDTDEFREDIDHVVSIITEEERVGALQCMIVAGMQLDPENPNRCKTPVREAIFGAKLSCYKLLLLFGAQNRVTFMEIDGNGSRIRVDYPIPIVLVMTTATYYVDEPQSLIPMLKIFRAFGGNLWEKIHSDFESYPWYTADRVEKTSMCKAGQNVLDFLKSNPDLLAKFPAGTIEELQQLMATPLSLVELARVQIWRTLGRDYLRSIPHLWIPRELQKFLEF